MSRLRWTGLKICGVNKYVIWEPNSNMLKTFVNPTKEQVKSLVERPRMDHSSLKDKIETIFSEVLKNGDDALFEMTQRFDKVALDNLKVSEPEKQNAISSLDEDLKKAILVASSNIEKFHRSQLYKPKSVTTMTGVECWQKYVPIERVGLYIPGGSAPLFSTVLMLCIPANIAGCREIALCSPPGRDGKIHPAILYAAHLCGVTNIYKLGGAQAIAALALGTQTIPKVYKIFGPGNQFVTAAKMKAQSEGTAIDLPAGPSEVLVLADETANPAFVASDLLSQAEHGPDSQVVLVSTDQILVKKIRENLLIQLENLERKDIMKQALEHSFCVITGNDEEAIEFVNEYAPEHLILASDKADQWAEWITNAGSVFIGNYTPESAGDYASGTNHTLPTNGYAKSHSGVTVHSFMKTISFQKISKEGLQNLGPTVEIMAMHESLDAHANAVRIRLKTQNSEQDV